MAAHKSDTRYAIMMAEAERQILTAAIDFCGSVADAASYLGVQKSHLYRRMRAIGVPAPSKPTATTNGKSETAGE